MSKLDLDPSSTCGIGSHQVTPSYRIGDLVWCQEARNNKLWWPAMVTYDPHLGIFYRISKQKSLQYHVQYFGISAIRGWVSFRSCVLLSDTKEKVFHAKGSSRKTKAEYAVAIQEVTEAAKLDYKQRKLKFIFSFGSSSKGGKKAGQKFPTKDATVVKVELKDDLHPPSVSKPEPVASELDVARTSRRKSTGSLLASDSSGGGGGISPLLGCKGDSSLSRRSSDRVKARKISRSDDTSEMELGGGGVSQKQSIDANKDTQLNLSDTPKGDTGGKPKTPTNGQWSGREGEKDGGSSPLCLHSTHSLRPSSRRRPSNSSPLDCRQCLEYMSNSEGLEMKCISKPETFIDSGVEMSVEPILMYVQKQYGSTGSLAPSKVNPPPPNLNRNPLTKGVSTKNVSTNLSNPAKQIRHATRLRGLDRKCSSSKGSSTSSSLSPAPSTLHPAPSNDNPSPGESGYKSGRNGIQALLSANGRQRRRRNSSIISLDSSVAVSPLTEMHSKQQIDTKPGEDQVSRKRKRGKSTSSSQSTEMDVNGKDEVLGGNEAEGATPIKRIRKDSSKPPTPVSQKKNILYSSDSAIASGSATNDSCSEVSVTSTNLTTSILTPPSSGSEEVPSVDFESDIDPTTERPTSRGQNPSSIAKERRKTMKQNIALVPDCKPNVCCICDCADTELLVCEGHCMKSFHLDCLGLVKEPSFKFVCDECLISSGTCFVCGKGDGEVKKCNKPRCSKLYHLECIQDNKLFRFGKSPSSFTCPLHVCARCTSIGMSTVSHSNLLQCIRCPLALHKPDCLVAGCEVIDHTRMVCYQHLKITRNTKLYSHINLNTCLECGAIGSLYCCDVCSAAYHLDCLDEDSRPAGDTNHWKCPSCAVHDLPTYGSLVITKFGVWRYVHVMLRRWCVIL